MPCATSCFCQSLKEHVRSVGEPLQVTKGRGLATTTVEQLVTADLADESKVVLKVRNKVSRKGSQSVMSRMQ